MSFSYGYHFCAQNQLNCARATLSGREATAFDAVVELKRTAAAIDKIVETVDPELVRKADEQIKS